MKTSINFPSLINQKVANSNKEIDGSFVQKVYPGKSFFAVSKKNNLSPRFRIIDDNFKLVAKKIKKIKTMS